MLVWAREKPELACCQRVCFIPTRPRTSTEDPVEEEGKIYPLHTHTSTGITRPLSSPSRVDSASSVSESDEDEADMNAASSTLSELQKAAGSLSGVADALSKAKQSRGEKKARKVRGVPYALMSSSVYTASTFRVHIIG